MVKRATRCNMMHLATVQSSCTKELLSIGFFSATKEQETSWNKYFKYFKRAFEILGVLTTHCMLLTVRNCPRPDLLLMMPSSTNHACSSELTSTAFEHGTHRTTHSCYSPGYADTLWANQPLQVVGAVASGQEGRVSSVRESHKESWLPHFILKLPKLHLIWGVSSNGLSPSHTKSQAAWTSVWGSNLSLIGFKWGRTGRIGKDEWINLALRNRQMYKRHWLDLYHSSHIAVQFSV